MFPPRPRSRRRGPAVRSLTFTGPYFSVVLETDLSAFVASRGVRKRKLLRTATQRSGSLLRGRSLLTNGGIISQGNDLHSGS